MYLWIFRKRTVGILSRIRARVRTSHISQPVIRNIPADPHMGGVNEENQITVYSIGHH
jgi:hypothetical protein